MQIDNFLEQFKRSASKAMEGDWTNSSTSASVPTTSLNGTSANINAKSLTRSKSRASCLDISELSGKNQ